MTDSPRHDQREQAVALGYVLRMPGGALGPLSPTGTASSSTASTANVTVPPPTGPATDPPTGSASRADHPTCSTKCPTAYAARTAAAHDPYKRRATTD